MKITNVRTKLLVKPITRVAISGERAATQRDVILVHVDTDEGISGCGLLTGLGQAEGSEAPVIKAVIDLSLRPLALGEDPFNYERIWQKMFLGTRRFGRKGAPIRAISGVDIAIWDIIGKKTRTPLCQLLGGYRDRMPVYLSGGHYFAGKGNDDLVAELRPHVERGITALKIRLGRGTVDQDVKRVRAVRDAFGPELKLMADANCAWDRNTAMRIAKRLEEFDLFWLEEPLAPDDVEGYAQLAAATSIPIAAGENEYTRYGFKELIDRRAVDVVQPDVARVGGVTEWIKVANMASAWGLPVAPHALQEVHIHLVAAVSNGLILELFDEHHPQHELLAQLITGPIAAKVIADGEMAVPTGPGIGLELDEAAIAEHEVR